MNSFLLPIFILSLFALSLLPYPVTSSAYSSFITIINGLPVIEKLTIANNTLVLNLENLNGYSYNFSFTSSNRTTLPSNIKVYPYDGYLIVIFYLNSSNKSYYDVYVINPNYMNIVNNYEFPNNTIFYQGYAIEINYTISTYDQVKIGLINSSVLRAIVPILNISIHVVNVTSNQKMTYKLNMSSFPLALIYNNSIFCDNDNNFINYMINNDTIYILSMNYTDMKYLIYSINLISSKIRVNTLNFEGYLSSIDNNVFVFYNNNDTIFCNGAHYIYIPNNNNITSLLHNPLLIYLPKYTIVNQNQHIKSKKFFNYSVTENNILPLMQCIFFGTNISIIKIKIIQINTSVIGPIMLSGLPVNLSILLSLNVYDYNTTIIISSAYFTSPKNLLFPMLFYKLYIYNNGKALLLPFVYKYALYGSNLIIKDSNGSTYIINLTNLNVTELPKDEEIVDGVVFNGKDTYYSYFDSVRDFAAVTNLVTFETCPAIVTLINGSSLWYNSTIFTIPHGYFTLGIYGNKLILIKGNHVYYSDLTHFSNINVKIQYDARGNPSILTYILVTVIFIIIGSTILIRYKNNL
ncbi:hypothetical protein SJAV_00480 [Sulfurisphaera javensis]|uniref:Thermopsin n=1 Tax=Sulfurisphaera javensis TaxID=2049879 RepID=A0AAT9GMV1_9CREN